VILLHFLITFSVEGSQIIVVFCTVWFPIPSAVLQLQENVTCYFITEPNQTIPRARTEPNPNSEGVPFSNIISGLWRPGESERRLCVNNLWPGSWQLNNRFIRRRLNRLSVSVGCWAGLCQIRAKIQWIWTQDQLSFSSSILLLSRRRFLFHATVSSRVSVCFVLFIE